MKESIFLALLIKYIILLFLCKIIWHITFTYIKIGLKISTNSPIFKKLREQYKTLN